ncbi:MAG: hypothetical protein AAF266_10735, partial [Planctomycetota bacterium]
MSRSSILRFAAIAAAVACAPACATTIWDSSPYVVEITLQIDSGCLDEGRTEQLRRGLVERLNQRLGLF